MTYTDPIKHVWGTQYDKERQTKRFLDHQNEEATRTREAQEIAARATAEHAAQQSAILEDMAHAQAREAELRRLMPHTLYELSQQQPKITALVDALLSGADGMEPEQCFAARLAIRNYVEALSRVDATYISDFSQKATLSTLREECSQMTERLCSEVPDHTRQLFVQGFVMHQFSPLASMSADSLAAYLSKAESYANMTTQAPPSVDLARLKAAGVWIIIGLGSTGISFMNDQLVLFWVVSLPAFLIAAYRSLKTEAAAEVHAATLNQTKLELDRIYPIKHLEDLKFLAKQTKWEDGGWVISAEHIESVHRRFHELWA